MEYLISVIIPVFNNKETLPETLNCILRQSVYSQAQIICVNDGSDDGSDEILKSYADKHSNILLISKENGGVSSARNEGLKYAEGKYTVFLDADDLLFPDNALFNICEKMEKENADAGIFRLMTFGFGGKEYNPTAEELSEKALIPCFDKKLLWNFPVSNKVYKTKLIKESKILFPDTVYTEDGAFWMDFIMKNQPKIIGIRSAVSLYRQSDPRKHRQATQSVTLKSAEDFIKSCRLISASVKAAAEKYQIPADTVKEFSDELDFRVCHILINGFYRKILRGDESFTEFIKDKYEAYSSKLPKERASLLKAVDLPEINFSKKYIAEHPEVSIKIKNPGEKCISSLICQTTPWFEVCSDSNTDISFVSHSSPKAETVISLNGDKEADPRLISGIIKIRKAFPFLPSFLLKASALIFFKLKG